MRPSVTLPTGTRIESPVSMTSMPRLRPSVESMATARTRSSPRCCWTSQTRISSPSAFVELAAAESWVSNCSDFVRLTVIALLIAGSLSGNTASITTPWISSIRPTFGLSSCCSLLVGSAVAAIRSPV